MKRIIDISDALYEAILNNKVQNGSVASRVALNLIQSSVPYEEDKTEQEQKWTPVSEGVPDYCGARLNKMEVSKMKIKCGRREFEVTEKDKILDNGAIYQLVTQTYREGWAEMIPVVAKSTFNRLLKEGKIKLSSKQFHGLPLYEFVIGRNQDEK